MGGGAPRSRPRSSSVPPANDSVSVGAWGGEAATSGSDIWASIPASIPARPRGSEELAQVCRGLVGACVESSAAGDLERGHAPAVAFEGDARHGAVEGGVVPEGHARRLLRRERGETSLGAPALE